MFMILLIHRDYIAHSCRVWSRVSQYTTTPVNAVWLVVAFCTCLNLIALGSSQTIASIFNITAPALDLSYITVVLCRRIYEHRVPFIEGPFTLGKWGPFINYTAICWVVFISVVLFFPPLKPVTAANMNYAICVAAVIAIVSMSWWFISARQYAIPSHPPSTNEANGFLVPILARVPRR
jgi:amino acid transporter